MSESAKGEDGFELLDAKEMQKRASIVAELYNDISSSDEDEEDDSQAKPQADEESKQTT